MDTRTRVVWLVAGALLLGACALDWSFPAPVAAGDAGGAPAPPPFAGACRSDAGPAMVRIFDDAGVDYCADATEVTNEQYSAFLASAPSNRHPRCASNASFVPERNWPFDARTAPEPVVGVDWCDAHAYCGWAGKTLCGGVRGGPVATRNANVPTETALGYACSGGGRKSYPYDGDYDPRRCNTANLYDGGTARLLPVASAPGCEGGYAGLHDLVGNAAEWMDSCEETSGAGLEDACGAFNSAYYELDAVDLTCGVVRPHARSFVDSGIGFRCCAITGRQ